MSAVQQTADSDELEALFDQVAGTHATQAAAANDRCASPEDDASDMINRVGKLTRQFHDMLCQLGLDKQLQGAAAAMSDARERLAYVARMTEQAAGRSLGAVEIAKPLQDAVAKGASELEIGRAHV